MAGGKPEIGGESLEAKTSQFVIKQVFGKRPMKEPIMVLPSTYSEIFNKKWDGEMIVNSRGTYIYTCPTCKTQVVGDLEDEFKKHKPQILCGGCMMGFDANIFSGDGPRFYLIGRESK